MKQCAKPSLPMYRITTAALMALALSGCGASSSPRGDQASGDGDGESSGDGDAMPGQDDSGNSGDGDTTPGDGDGTPGDGDEETPDDDGGTSEGTGDGGIAGDPALLVPAQGALIGQYYGDENIEDTAKKLGRALPLHLTYYDFTHDWVHGQTEDDLKEGRIPFVNWEVFDTKLDEILSGQHDAMLAKRAKDAKALGKKFFVDFGAEMNGEWSPWGGAQNGMSSDKYIQAYKHVHDALAEVDNAIWVWCPNVTDEPRAEWNRAMAYYPGDAYVDWVCVDGYNWGNTGGNGWQSFREVFEDIYPLLAATNKPIMIGEMASAESGGDKAAFIDGMIPTLERDYPRIKGLIWFDVNKETDWRISSSPEAEAAFKRMVNDPYFNP